jgi:hypothetical protein
LDVPNSSSTLHVPHGNRYSGILSGESYISIRVLADLFLCALKYPTSFLAPLLGNGSCSRIKPSSFEFHFSFYHLFTTFFFLPLYHMYSTPIYKYSTPKGDMLEPPPSSQPILTDGYKLHPIFIAMVQDKPFSGLKNENPYTHLREFEHLCSCLAIAGMTQETIK